MQSPSYSAKLARALATSLRSAPSCRISGSSGEDLSDICAAIALAGQLLAAYDLGVDCRLFTTVMTDTNNLPVPGIRFELTRTNLADSLPPNVTAAATAGVPA